MKKKLLTTLAAKHSTQSMKGFSAVELLVTLFIAVLFLAMGYTIYGAISTSSSVSRHRAQADNIANEYLRRYESTVTSPCIVSTPLSNQAVAASSADGLAAPRVTVEITCPNSSLTSLSKVKVTVTYNESGVQRSAYHEVFASTE